MSISEKAKEYREKMFRGDKPELSETDPEFAERFENFAYMLKSIYKGNSPRRF